MIPLHIKVLAPNPWDALDAEDDDFCPHDIDREDFCGECDGGLHEEPEFDFPEVPDLHDGWPEDTE